ncbi:isocitrate lyase/PEP mutase family protein [Aliamphritea ceti]|uniref:isocitrate lyase/PEP mutase family protein n=1 Tax=Aliamphritea ceti TaxID=1524258 RepID=UPI0021C3BCF1|nr:isocitrate lyase/PEP mutase family protein [Aliamphritea ceti]
MKKTARTRMRALLENHQCVPCASVFDPMSARMADDIGFKTGILGGSVTSLMTLGVPDICQLTLSELVEQARRVCRASDLPVIVDGDNGYGNALNVVRTIEALEYACASLVTLEDTVLPHGYNGSPQQLISVDEACSKLKAALKTRRDPEFAIFARTHALPGQSVESLLKRVIAYTATGIDGLCIFGLTDKDILEQVAANTHLPLMLISYGDTDLGSQQALADNKVRIRLQGHLAYEAAVRATYHSLQALHSRHNPEAKLQHTDAAAKTLIREYSRQSHYEALIRDYVTPAG